MWNGLNAPIAPYIPPKITSSKSSRQRARLYERQQGLCAFCDLPFTEEDKESLDHIKPRSKGGSDKISNKVLVHGSCNQLKGDLEFYDDALLRAIRFIEMAKRLKAKGYLK